MEGGSQPHLVEEPQNYHIGYSPHYSHEPPHQANLSPHYSLGPQHQEPFSPHQGFPLPYSSYGSPHHSYGPQYPDNVLSDFPYQQKENEWEEEEDEEDDDSLPSDTLEEALQELNIHLPRLAVTAPPSVLPPKGGGRCWLAAQLRKFLLHECCLAVPLPYAKLFCLSSACGVCGLRDEAFAGMEQQEAHELLAGLLLWLHQDLAVRKSIN